MSVTGKSLRQRNVDMVAGRQMSFFRPVRQMLFNDIDRLAQCHGCRRAKLQIRKGESADGRLTAGQPTNVDSSRNHALDDTPYIEYAGRFGPRTLFDVAQSVELMARKPPVFLGGGGAAGQHQEEDRNNLFHPPILTHAHKARNIGLGVSTSCKAGAAPRHWRFFSARNLRALPWREAGSGNAPTCPYTSATSRRQRGLAAFLTATVNADREAVLTRAQAQSALIISDIKTTSLIVDVARKRANFNTRKTAMEEQQ